MSATTTQTLTVAVTGSSGLVGSALLPLLREQGHRVLPVVRREGKVSDAIVWDPAEGKIEKEKFAEVDAVVHLAGENIAEGRWTAAKKERIRQSRVQGTELLARTLADLPHKPRVLVSASATGFYGDRGSEVCDESSTPGDSFLAEVCQAWEAAAKPAAEAGIRVVHPRIGIVLSGEGGALRAMLLPFKLGIGGRISSGQQYWSWVSRVDLVDILQYCILNESLVGPVNAVAPEPVTNREFTRVLGHVLGRPTLFPIPAPGARLLLGEMAEALLLTSARVVPTKLQQSGFHFRYPGLEVALIRALNG